MIDLKYTEILHTNKELTTKVTGKPYNIGVLSNVTVNSLKEVLEYSCRINNIVPMVEIGNFDNIVQDSLNFSQKDTVIVFYDTLNIVDNISDFFEDLSDETYLHLKQKFTDELSIIFENLKHTASVVFNSFSDSYFPINILAKTKICKFIIELNSYLLEHAPNNFTIVDITKLYTQLGLNTCIDKRFYLSSKAPYTFLFLKNYVSSIESIILKNCGKLKKALIFDCDNTLWGGIIGEDGIENIEMNASSKNGVNYKKIQQIAVYLSKRGIIIGLCSKNNEADVLDVLRNHKDMILKEEHIIISKINWSNKSSNLKSIASELNIGLDSLVFIDDSSFEVNLVREQLPEVLTLQVPEKLNDYPNYILTQVYKYFNLSMNIDDQNKTQMYKEQFQRETVKQSFNSIEDYLSTLEIEIEILKDDKTSIPRISQLTQKTNQFNLNSYRFTETQIEKFMNCSNHYVFSMVVKDKFGDSGLTGVCIVKIDEQNSNKIIIDAFLMSCRIIGRNIEYAFINNIINNIKNLGFQDVSATFIQSKKNSQVANFYDKVGLTLINDNNNIKEYSLDLANFNIENIQYIKVLDKNKIK